MGYYEWTQPNPFFTLLTDTGVPIWPIWAWPWLPIVPCLARRPECISLKPFDGFPRNFMELSRFVVVYREVHLSIWPKWAFPWAGAYKSETAKRIISVSSWAELFKPVLVQYHKYLTISPIYAFPWVRIHVSATTDWFSPFEVLWDCRDLYFVFAQCHCIFPTSPI